MKFYHYKEFKNIVNWMGGFLPVNIVKKWHKDKPSESLLNHICTYDTETTTLFLYPEGNWDVYNFERDIHNYDYNEEVPKNAVDYNMLSKHTLVYLWTFTLYAEKWDVTFYGRRNSEFLEFIKEFKSQLELQEHQNVNIQIYVHNLAFDFANSLQNIFAFSEVFARKAHKPIYARTMGNDIEFRCSYFLTNSSLANLTKDNKKYKKQTDFEDYLKVRTPDTDLKDDPVLPYAALDTASLAESLQLELKYYKRVDKIPLTSTGKLRRTNKEYLSGNSSIQRDKKCVPDLDNFKIQFACFQGGDTHTNVMYSAMVLNWLDSLDKASSYPSVEIYKKFPCSPFLKDHPANWERYLNHTKKCFIGCFTFSDLKCKGSIPYIKTYKAFNIRKPKYDNGRIYQAEELTMWLTNIDMQIIMQHYKIKSIVCIDLRVADWDYLTYKERRFILEMYKDKTELKGIAGREEDYMRQKNGINSNFGREVTRPVDVSVSYNNNTGEWEAKEPTDVEIEEALNKKRKKAQYTMYARGIFITAWARFELYRGIDIFDNHSSGISKHVYNDTDSCKGFADEEILQKFEELNQDIMREAKEVLPEDLFEMCHPKDKKGIEHFLGTWDHETKKSEEKYKQFISFGAKKYAYVLPDESVHITVSGLSKKCGKHLKDITEFCKNRLFKSDISGRTLAIYQTNQPVCIIDGHKYEDCYSLSILPTTYRLGMTDEYEALVYYSQHEKIQGEDYNGQNIL